MTGGCYLPPGMSGSAPGELEIKGRIGKWRQAAAGGRLDRDTPRRPASPHGQAGGIGRPVARFEGAEGRGDWEEVVPPATGAVANRWLRALYHQMKEVPMAA